MAARATDSRRGYFTPPFVPAASGVILPPLYENKRRPPMASVTFEHVTKKFNETTALNDLNISVAKKEFWVLVGPGEGGKSTALRSLAGMGKITGGRVLSSGP